VSRSNGERSATAGSSRGSRTNVPDNCTKNLRFCAELLGDNDRIFTLQRPRWNMSWQRFTGRILFSRQGRLQVTSIRYMPILYTKTNYQSSSIHEYGFLRERNDWRSYDKYWCSYSCPQQECSSHLVRVGALAAEHFTQKIGTSHRKTRFMCCNNSVTEPRKVMIPCSIFVLCAVIPLASAKPSAPLQGMGSRRRQPEANTNVVWTCTETDVYPRSIIPMHRLTPSCLRFAS